MNINQLPKEPFDPKLREAMAEMVKIIEKYDIAATIHLQSKSHCEFLFAIDPSWSCVKFENTPQGACLRFKAKAKTGGPEERERARLTTGMLISFHSLSKQTQEHMEKVLAMVGKYIEVEHIEGPIAEAFYKPRQ